MRTVLHRIYSLYGEALGHSGGGKMMLGLLIENQKALEVPSYQDFVNGSV